MDAALVNLVVSAVIRSAPVGVSAPATSAAGLENLLYFIHTFCLLLHTASG